MSRSQPVLRQAAIKSMKSKTDEKKVRSEAFGIAELLRPHWRAISLALLAVLGEIAADLLEPWPLKMVIDYVLQGKQMPDWLAATVSKLTGNDPIAVLNAAVVGVAAIAIIGGISTYSEKYLTTSVGQWVTHDLRRTLYHHIHRLSLSQHAEARVGDLISSVTNDIEAIHSFLRCGEGENKADQRLAVFRRGPVVERGAGLAQAGHDVVGQAHEQRIGLNRVGEFGRSDLFQLIRQLPGERVGAGSRLQPAAVLKIGIELGGKETHLRQQMPGFLAAVFEIGDVLLMEEDHRFAAKRAVLRRAER